MKKMSWKVISLIAIVVVALGAYSIAFADTIVKPTATLSGVVAADGLVKVGASVSEGQVLVQVKLYVQVMLKPLNLNYLNFVTKQVNQF